MFKNFLSKPHTINIQNCLPDGVFVINKDGNIQWANDVAENMLSPLNSIVNLPIDDYLENGMDNIIDAATYKKIVTAKLINTPNYFDISAKAGKDSYTVIIRTSSVSNLVTDKSDEEQIDTNKNTFLLKLSNDLKSPLHSVVGFSQAIIDGLGGEVSEKQEKYLKIINKNSSDLLYFFEKLMDLLRTESNIFEKELKYFDISNIVGAIIKTNQQLYSEKQLDVNLSIADDTKKTIYADEKAFKLMFQTLLEIIMRSSDLGTIDINISNADEEYLGARNINVPSALLISVLSSNNSVLESELPTLFNPYAVVDKSNKRAVLRALTLASVRNIVTYMRGIVWAEIIPLKGTAFNIILPLEKDLNE